ncbi:MAG: MerR family transcriptional regulator [Planctomycetes bacterium]|nr:MerR family transcriptional regulator [Planctomycetota bacterium]
MTATLIPTAPTAPAAAPASPAPALNINDASKACGLSPSVLRIWELRYGWPNPRRRANGYRAYSAHQVQELKRVAQLVKNGSSISQLIVDGLPRFPADGSTPQAPRGLPRTRALVRSRDGRIKETQDAVIEALDTRNAPVAQERLQRAVWTLRPADEPAAALVPILVGVAEARANGRPFTEEAALLTAVRTRSQQIQRMMRQGPGALAVVAVGDDVSQVAAQLVALILNQRCVLATPVAVKPASGPWLAVGEGESAGAVGQVTLFGGEGQLALADLLDATKLLPWSKK